MRKEYDFSKARKNPYASQLQKQITIRLDEDAIDYFKGISEKVGSLTRASSTSTSEIARHRAARSICRGSRP